MHELGSPFLKAFVIGSYVLLHFPQTSKVLPLYWAYIKHLQTFCMIIYHFRRTCDQEKKIQTTTLKVHRSYGRRKNASMT